MDTYGKKKWLVASIIFLLFATIIGSHFVIADESQEVQQNQTEENVDIAIQQDMEKYLLLQDNQVLLQQKIRIDYHSKASKGEASEIVIDVPKHAEKNPDIAIVLYNGQTLDEEKYTYKQQEGKIAIQNPTIQGKNELTEEYKVIYGYMDTGIVENFEVYAKVEVHVTLENHEETYNNQNEYKNVIHSMGNKISMIGNIIQSTDKGYLYANNKKDTIFVDRYNIEVSNLQDAGELTIASTDMNFIISDEQQVTAQEDIMYKSTIINKKDMLKILGEEGEIQVLNQNNEVIQTLNKDTETDDNGNMNITYANGILAKDVKFHTSTPKNIGTLQMTNIKYMTANIHYQKQEIKTFKKLTEKMIVNDSEQTVEMNLNEPKTTITADMDKEQLDTMNEQNELALKITLNSKNASERLFNHPYIEVTFPEQVEKITLKEDAKILYNEELNIEQCMVENNVIRIYVSGTQNAYKEGIIAGGEINLKLNVKLNNKASDSEEKIYIKCMNEGEEATVEKTMKVVSPKDMITVNSIEELNVETVGQEGTKIVQIPTEDRNKTLQVKSRIINNNKTVSDIRILGNLPTDNNQLSQNGETVNNMGITLNTPIATNNENATIYYTEKADANNNLDDENNQWSTNATQNASKYLIVLDSMEPKEELELQYHIQMADDLEYNESAYQGYAIEYTDTQKNTQNSLASTYLLMTTGAGPVVETTLHATVGNRELKENDVVRKGEVIRYIIDVTNSGTEDVADIKLNGNIPEGTVYVTPVEGYAFETGAFYEEKADVKNIEGTLLNLEVGETVKKYYEVRVKSDTLVDSTITNMATIEYNGVKKQSETLNNKVGDATLRISIKCVIGEDVTISEGDIIQYQAIIENISNETQNNITLKWNASDAYTLQSQSFSQSDDLIQSDTMTIDKIEANQKVVIDGRFLVDKVVGSTQEVEVYAELTQGNNTYLSNNWKEQVVSQYNVDVVMESNNEGETLQPGDEIIYTIKMVNNNLSKSNISLYDELPIELSITGVAINEQEQSIETESNIIEITGIELDPQEQATIVIKAIVDYMNNDNTVDIANTASIFVNGKEKQSNEIKNTIQFKAESVNNIDISLETNHSDTVLEPENEVNYQIKLVNHNFIPVEVDLYDDIPTELNIQGIYINGEEYQRENSRNTIEVSGIELQPEEEKTIEIKTIVDNNGGIDETKEISNTAKISFNGEEKSSNTITNQIVYKAEDVENIDIQMESANQEEILKPGDQIQYTIKLVNHNYENANVAVQDFVPNELTITKIIVNGVEQTFEEGTNIVGVENLELERQVENVIEIQTVINEIEDLNEIKEISNNATVIFMDKEKASNIIRHHVQYKTEASENIDITMKANKENEEIKAGEEIIYTITLTNHDVNPTIVSVKDELPAELTLQNVYVNGMMQNPGEEANMVSVESVEIPAQGESTIEVHTIVNEKAEDDARETVEITNRASAIFNETEVKSNIVRHTISYKVEDDNDDNDDNDNDNDDNDDDDDNPSAPGENEERYTISGMVWVDEDKNGEMKGTEERLQGIPVYLVDISTGTIAKDDNGNEMTAMTNDSGYYSLENVSQGSYMVAFEYDTSQYQLTAYMQNAVEDTKTSKVVARKMNLTGEERTYAVTDTIQITNTNIPNMHMGLIVSEIFDMQLEKYISRIVVSDPNNRIQYDYNQTSIAKIELRAKTINDTNVTVEYQIKVSNIGEMAGYVKEVVDYLPEGFSFNETVNKDWTLKDGMLINASLTNEELQPGESRILTLVLTKSMTAEETGTYTNLAELSEVYNVNGVADINSTPNNQQNGENDMSKAELIISISTGAAMMYIGLAITIIVTIFIGVYIIKKKVL